VTDRFLVAVDLTITDAERMKTFASVVRFIEIADVQATSQEADARVRLRVGSADVTLPLPAPGSSQQARARVRRPDGSGGDDSSDKQFSLPQKGWSGTPYYVRASLLMLGLADSAQLFPTA
jgi:hypothetical protein